MSRLSITSFRWSRKRPQDCGPLPQEVSVARETPFPSDFNGLWNVAYREYQLSLTKASRAHGASLTPDLERCTTPDEILCVLVDKRKLLGKSRRGGEKSHALRAMIKPIVRGVSIILETAAETASSLNAPGGKGIFAAISVLMQVRPFGLDICRHGFKLRKQAADRMSVTLDDLEKLFGRLKAFTGRLEVRLKGDMSREAKEIAVRALIQILKSLELVTTAIERSRPRRFVDELLGAPLGVRFALDTLAEITAEENGLALAEASVAIQRMSTQLQSLSEIPRAPLASIPEEDTEVGSSEITTEVAGQTSSLQVARVVDESAEYNAIEGSSSGFTSLGEFGVASTNHGTLIDASSYTSMHALIIGIDSYHHRFFERLQSAVKDADNVHRYLTTQLRIPDEHIVVLRNEQATKRAIIKQIQLLSDHVSHHGDPVLIYFAGYGATLTSALGSNDHGGRSISAIIPHDCEVDVSHRLNGTISYRTLDLLLCELALGSETRLGIGDNITVIFDCHTPHPDIQWTPSSLRLSDKDAPEIILYNRSFLSNTPKPATWPYILLSGSSEGQQVLNYIDGASSFTEILLSILQQGFEDLTYHDVIMNFVLHLVSSQTPSCQGRNADRFLFRTCRRHSKDHSDTCYATYRNNNPGRFLIPRGAIHGVAQNDRFILDVPSGPATEATATAIGGSSSELSVEPPDAFNAPEAPSTITARPSPSTYALHLHIADGSEDVSALMVKIRRPEKYGLMFTDASRAHLSIYKTLGNHIQYSICDQKVKEQGLSSLCQTTTQDQMSVTRVLRAASRFFKRIQFEHEVEGGGLAQHVTVKCHELKGDLGSTTTWDHDTTGDIHNLCHNNTIEVTQLDNEPAKGYGITLSSTILTPLHVWVFYYDYSALSIKEIYRPPMWGLVCGKPSLPAGGGRLRIGHGTHQGEPFKVPRLQAQKDVTVGLLKVFLSKEPFDMSGFEQKSPFEHLETPAVGTRSPSLDCVGCFSGSPKWPVYETTSCDVLSIIVVRRIQPVDSG